MSNALNSSVQKSAQAFRTISEVAADLDVPQHVLRFWESKFSQVRPLKRGGGRRYYRPEDIELLRGIRTLLYDDGFTIKGVQKVFRERGVKYVVNTGKGGPDGAVSMETSNSRGSDAQTAAAGEAPSSSLQGDLNGPNPESSPESSPELSHEQQLKLNEVLKELLELKEFIRSSRGKTRTPRRT